jgi:mannose-1-phosphate guanylyltransferase
VMTADDSEEEEEYEDEEDEDENETSMMAVEGQDGQQYVVLEVIQLQDGSDTTMAVVPEDMVVGGDNDTLTAVAEANADGTQGKKFWLGLLEEYFSTGCFYFRRDTDNPNSEDKEADEKRCPGHQEETGDPKGHAELFRI